MSTRRKRGSLYRAVQKRRGAGPRVGNAAPACGYCRKRLYASRAEAKFALRVLHPAAVGAQMKVYRCDMGGAGFHIGHRDPRFEHPDDTPEET